jgi:hypothetical protein
VNSLTARYLSTNHPILTAMLEGYLPAALVLVQRTGRDVPALGQATAPDNRDISVSRDVFDPDRDQLRLLALAESHTPWRCPTEPAHTPRSRRIGAERRGTTRSPFLPAGRHREPANPLGT